MIVIVNLSEVMFSPRQSEASNTEQVGVRSCPSALDHLRRCGVAISLSQK